MYVSFLFLDAIVFDGRNVIKSPVLHLITLLIAGVAVISVCKRFKEQVVLLDAPIRGVAPMLAAVQKLQSSSEHLTSLHPEFLLLCLLAKCYKTGMSILEDDIFEVDQPRDFFLYCYYGWVAFASLHLSAHVYENFHFCCGDLLLKLLLFHLTPVIMSLFTFLVTFLSHLSFYFLYGHIA